MTERSRSTYDLHRERARDRSSALVAIGQEIGPIPPVVDPERRESCVRSLQLFCEAYFPRRFLLRWSPDHLRVIGILEAAVLFGGLFAVAMPRGSGKTTLVEVAAIWATLIGARKFVMLIGQSDEAAQNLLKNIQSELTNNALLAEDFPEVLHPIRRLEGETRRQRGQRYFGQRTLLTLSESEVRLPTIPGSRASGGLILSAGILGNLRGALRLQPDGTSLRPDFVIVDDPQTDESARSPTQVSKREAVINGAILNLAGPGKKIAAAMPCTVIVPDDLADRILDRSKHPDWQGVRTKLIYEWPKSKLWIEYAKLRAESQVNDGRGESATELYRKNRQAMDEGAVVAWPERFAVDELSALQHAWNLRLRDERAFFAEYQNDPLPDYEASEDDLDADTVVSKTNGLKRGEVPHEADVLTMFIDVQGKLLYWLVAAWESNFTGSIIDYGTWPDQKLASFTLRDSRRTIAQAIPGAGTEGGIYGALEKLCDEQLGREFRKSNGGTQRVARCLVDANWGRSTDVVYKFCRQCNWANIVSPSHGRYVGASSVPFSDYRKNKGDKVGLHWRVPASTGRRAVRYVLFDTNWWKSFVHDRLRTPIGDSAAMSLWAALREQHRMIAEQLTSERKTAVQARGRTVDEYRLKQPGLDNHFFDCIVGASVAASMSDVRIEALSSAPKRNRVKLSELQARKRAIAV